jgi:hypothetical protein
MEVKEWYGAKTVYQVESNTVQSPQKLYEERIIILKATSFDDAISEAEREAELYAHDESGIKYLGYVNVFKIFDEEIQDKTEVFSLMRESDLNSEEYIDRHLDTGTERTK